jgi:nucleoside-diphosphate-sugar epimerase
LKGLNIEAFNRGGISEMRCLVTGAGGFIGSHLCEGLLERGCLVRGVDAFLEFYPRWMKERNLDSIMKKRGFQFIEGDLLRIDLKSIMEGIDVVFHLSAQPGVRKSWGRDFQSYVDNNIIATQRLLEHSLIIKPKLFIYASSSSVYGNVDQLPIIETARTRPISPYGVTKLAGENLCYLYWRNMGIPTVTLRFFTVYGPRQRPDMAFHRFIRAILNGEEITIFGNGKQTRDFTYISDVVEANILCMEKGVVGEEINIGGGSRTTLMEVVDLLGEISGIRPRVKFMDVQKGDVRDTWADISKAKKILGYRPEVPIEEGLKREFHWLKGLIEMEKGGKS